MRTLGPFEVIFHQASITGVIAADGSASADTHRMMRNNVETFRGILDDVRREFACALLQDRSLSVGDIAFFLQYSEPAAFHRAFRRWTGQAPGDFRIATG